MKGEKLKRAVIKEEFVVLTGNAEQAVILNQFDYWSHRTNDIDKYIDEEITRQTSPETVNILERSKTNGWIYKSAKELLEEIMLSISEKTTRRHLVELVKHGWLQERGNVEYQWDKTKQYRYNLAKVAEDLQILGYQLEGWKMIIDANVASKGHGVASKGHGVASTGHGVASENPATPRPVETPSVEIWPEITIENTSETTSSCHSTNDEKQKCSSYFPRFKNDKSKLDVFKYALKCVNKDNVVCKTLYEFVIQSPETVRSACDELREREKDHFNYFTKIFFTHLQKGAKGHGKQVDYDAIDESLYNIP